MKKSKEQTLEEKYDTALVAAGRFDVFGIIAKMNKKRERKKRKLLEKLGLEIIEPEEFDITEWSPRVPRSKKKK